MLHKQAQHWAAFVFGIVFVIVLLTLAIFFPNPTAFQYTIFRTVLALAAAGVAAMIPGFISLSISKWIRAGGALAVFVVVYFYSPAAMVSSTSSHATYINGDQNQVVNGNTGPIAITSEKSTPKGTKTK